MLDKLKGISWQGVAALAVLVGGAVAVVTLAPEGEMRTAVVGVLVALAGVLRVRS